MIPFSLGASLSSVISGVIVTLKGRYRAIVWGSWATMVLGWGLMTTLDDHSNTAQKVLYPFVTALGIGCLFMVPLIALQAAMPIKDMATSTGAFGFLRTMGGTVGIAVGQAIYTSVLRKKLNKIPNLNGFDTSPAALSESVRTLQRLPQPEQGEIVHAYTQSISAIWVFNAPVVAVGFIMVLFIKAYTLKRTTIKGGARTSTDVEAAGREGTTSVGTPTAAEVETDLPDEKSEVHNEVLQEDSEDQNHITTGTSDQITHTDASEKV